MGKIELAKPVKLFVGFITSDTGLIKKAGDTLINRFGPVECESPLWDFTCTSYYNKELGASLKRQFLSFERLISAEDTSNLKIFTNKIEKGLSVQGKRRVNIDPGYITLSKLILLTTKDFSHRTYLGRGIYAEVTLIYKDKAFHPFEWSYPDYRSQGYREFFNDVRKRYADQLSHL